MYRIIILNTALIKFVVDGDTNNRKSLSFSIVTFAKCSESENV